MKSEAAREIRTDMVRLPAAAGWLRMLGVEGALDSADHPLLAAIRDTAGQPEAVAVDLSTVREVSVAAARGLAECAAELDRRGIRLLLAAPSEEVTRALTAANGNGNADTANGTANTGNGAGKGTADGRLVVLPTAHDVITACVPAPPETVRAAAVPAPLATTPDEKPEPELEQEIERLRGKVRDLRGKVRTHPMIAQAQGVLQERYRLRDGQAAFALLRNASQQHNVKLRSLASAVLNAPRPKSGTARWFPDRIRTRPPKLSALPQVNGDATHRGAVISAVLHQSLTLSDTPMGNVQLTDRHAGGLRIEAHHGLNEEFVDYFDLVGKEGTSCALAARNVTRVTVTDVATDPVFTDEARYKILQAGSRAAHSTPLTTANGVCLGMVSTHHDRPQQLLAPAQARALDRIGDQAGRWLAWHHRTIVLDALEHLHRTATAA
ncbi:ANTAR domain-containing protein [Streptomyces ochraceiscleroticus]|uniref:ANTAR domain-containing protein n=1 Tax=Streptomyces ochraceiscleroticus TaxID=47761 RepID=A0ABW1MIB5_9ACTN|nr:ANTAR domain-containing protein [Streptomyces ochraceiscleroticus]